MSTLEHSVRRIAAVGAVALFVPVAPAAAATVVRVIDGDTVKVRDDGKRAHGRPRGCERARARARARAPRRGGGSHACCPPGRACGCSGTPTRPHARATSSVATGSSTPPFCGAAWPVPRTPAS